MLLKYLKDLKKDIRKNSISDIGKLLRDLEVRKKKMIEANLKEIPKQTLKIEHAVVYQLKARKATRIEKLEYKEKMLNNEINQINENLEKEEKEGFYSKIFGKKLGLFKTSDAAKRSMDLYQELETVKLTMAKTRLTGKVTVQNNKCYFEESNPVIKFRDQQLKELKKVEDEIKKNNKRIRNAARLNVSQKYLNEKLNLFNKLTGAIETLQIEKEDLQRNLQYIKKEKNYIQAQMKEEFKETYLKKKDAYYQKMLNIQQSIKDKYQEKVSKFYEIVEDMSAAFYDMTSKPRPRKRRVPAWLIARAQNQRCKC